MDIIRHHIVARPHSDTAFGTPIAQYVVQED
jgi:hypothetical protein